MNQKEIEKAYWDDFYKESEVSEKPSSFALLALSYIDRDFALIELGCGNGRDSIFFQKNGIKIFAFDLSEKAIELNLKRNLENIDFIHTDFTMPSLKLLSTIKAKSVYSRFTLHSVDKTGFENTLKWVSDFLPATGKFFIEARTINDALFGKGIPLPDDGFETTHYRRFLRPYDVKVKLEELGFKLLYFVEDYLSAVYNNDGAVVVRIICERNPKV